MSHNIRLDLEIAFQSRWHAGSGEGSFATDRLTRRDASNRPYVPASTLKGIVRQSCEKIARTLDFPNPSDPHRMDWVKCPEVAQHGLQASPIDLLFGTKQAPGELYFRDACPADEAVESPFTWIRAARHRVLGTAKDKHLFGTQYCPPQRFKTRVDGWHRELVTWGGPNDLPHAYCLLIIGILAVERIGGDKSTGAGWLEGALNLEQAAYNGTAVDLDRVFDYLSQQDYLELIGEAL
jgi:CRISPR/Cas system CSM-associated protein Csm3 (group 7 of RAMP superfamily)